MGREARVTTRPCDLGPRDGLGKREVLASGRFAHLELGEDRSLGLGRGGALCDPGAVCLVGDEVHALEITSKRVV